MKSIYVHSYGEPFVVDCTTNQDFLDVVCKCASNWIDWDFASEVQKDSLIHCTAQAFTKE